MANGLVIIQGIATGTQEMTTSEDGTLKMIDYILSWVVPFL